MRVSEQTIESRAHFIGKISVVYAVYAAVCAAFVWYTLRHNLPIRWAIGGAALVCALGLLALIWTLRAYGQRYRAGTRAFYSKLRSELLPTNEDGDEAAALGDAPDGTVIASLGMYTRRETVGLTLLSMYQKRRSAIILVGLSLVIVFGMLFAFNDNSLSMRNVLGAFGIVIAYNVFIFVIVYAGSRYGLRRIWKGKTPFIVSISSQGVKIGGAIGSPSLVPWTSIDRVWETRSWILCMRNGRRIVALPIARIPRSSLERLRQILKAAKRESAVLRDR